MTGVDAEKIGPVQSELTDSLTSSYGATRQRPASRPATASRTNGTIHESVEHLSRRSPRDGSEESGLPRVSKWDRPTPLHDWRWWISSLGKTLITVGLLMLGFVAYQLWGTGIENAAAQRELEADFDELLAQFDPIESVLGDNADGVVPLDTSGNEMEYDSSSSPEATAGGVDNVMRPLEWEQQILDPSGVVPVAEQNLPPVEDGDPIARIEIPRIGVDDIVVAGIAISDLKRGPGHFPDTPLPGQLGNAVIAGHRTTYGSPFSDVNKVNPGEEIIVTTLNGRFVYRVTGKEIVAPSAYEVIATIDPSRATLTLVSCHPRYTAKQRIIISAELDVAMSGRVGEPTLNHGRPPDPPVFDETDDGSRNGSIPRGIDDGPSTDGTVEWSESVPSYGDSSSGGPRAEPAVIDDLLSVDRDSASVDVFSMGWFSDPAANPHVGFWGFLATSIALLAYAVSREVRRDWVGLFVGIIPFLVVLYFFFQNVNRLLPPNL